MNPGLDQLGKSEYSQGLTNQFFMPKTLLSVPQHTKMQY